MDEQMAEAGAWHITRTNAGFDWYFRECHTVDGQKLWLYGFANTKPEHAEIKERILQELREGSIDSGAILVEVPDKSLENVLKEASKYITRAG